MNKSEIRKCIIIVFNLDSNIKISDEYLTDHFKCYTIFVGIIAYYKFKDSAFELCKKFYDSKFTKVQIFKIRREMCKLDNITEVKFGEIHYKVKAN